MITEPRKRDIALVVDDSPETLRLLTDALDGAGMTVMVALDGAGAMRIVDQITPDIVLLDAVMPGMDGFETCRRLKRDAGLANVPIIFMTGLAETEHIVRGLEAGGVDYVTKPIVVEVMLARIRVHLANARLTQSARAALDASGRYLLAVSRLGKIMWATPQAQKLLSDSLSADADDDFVLPDPMLQWLEQVQKGKAGSKAPVMAAFPGNELLKLQYMGKLGPNEFRQRAAQAAIHGQARAERVFAKARQGFRRRHAGGILQRTRPDGARGRSAVLAVQRKNQPGYRANPGLEPAYRRQAP
jgi:CheY-like chemotaxis protein